MSNGQPEQNTKTYTINRMHLHTTNLPGQPVNITSLYQKLTIEENIFKPFIEGSLTIFDGAGYQEIFPIMGEEHLELDIISSFDDFLNETPRRIRGLFRIYNVTPMNTIGSQPGKAFTLDFISEQYFQNLRTKVHYSTIDKKQTLSRIVKTIYENYIKFSESNYDDDMAAGYRKDIEIENTLRNYQIIFPNVSPYQAILMCAKRSISKDTSKKGASFLFYEEFEKFHFKSLESIQQEPEKFILVYIPNLDDKTKIDEVYSRNQTADFDFIYIDNYQINRSFDVMENMSQGMYSSKLITHDFERMQYHEYDFEYVPKLDFTVKTIKRDGKDVRVIKKTNPNSNDVIVDRSKAVARGKLTTTLNDMLNHPDQKVHLTSTTLNHDIVFDVNQSEPGGYEQKGIEPKDIEKYFLQRNSQIQQFDNVKVEVALRNSNTKIKVGDVVKFNLPSDIDPGQMTVPDTHFYYSGNYVVSKVVHSMSGTEGLATTITICKNGLEHSMPAFNDEVRKVLGQLDRQTTTGKESTLSNPEDYVEDGR